MPSSAFKKNNSVGAGAAEYLAKDQTKLETFPITLDAGHGVTVVFFFNDTATTEIYTLSLHDALPICGVTELVTPAGNLTDTGTIGFSDVDLTDSHSISPTIVASVGEIGRAHV